ncbi:MAG TPA: hypothetical protein VEG62_04690 [Acidimicrobiales bacterium]|nr:hypothetical protein [Acidimicrobiales bacterium]
MRDDRLDAAFEAWLAAQRAALDVVRQATGVPEGSEVDLAEGYRWVTRLSRLALDWFVERSDPLHPQLFDLQDEYKKLLVDNPDVRYTFCVLDDTRSYRLVGYRGECAYLGMTFGTPFGQGPVGGRTGTQTQTHIDEFELGPNGEVDILMAPASAMPEPRPRNAVVLEPGTRQLAIRETHFDKRPEKFSRLRVELVPEPGEVVPPPLLTVDDLAPKLEFAAAFLSFVGVTALQMWHDAGATMNRFSGRSGQEHVASQEDEVRSHSNAEMTYHGGRFRLEPGQALVVRVRQPERPFLYWGLTLCSPWMESFDSRYATTARNNHTAALAPDGSWRLVIASADPGPGAENWLDTGGRLEGYMLVRWVLADDPPVPSAEVVALADLRGPGPQTSEGTPKRSW